MNHYGYKLEQMSEELTVSNTSRGLGKARADIVIWKSKEDKIASKMLLLLSSVKQKMFELEKKIIIKGVTMPDGPVPNSL